MKLSKFIFSLQIRLSSIYRGAIPHWQDILIVVVIAVAAGFASYQGAQLINPVLTLDKQATDAWFNNDTTRVFDDMAVYSAHHDRTNLHPLFVLIALPPVYALQTALSVAVVLWIALLSLGIWGLFSMRKHLRLRVVLVLTLLGQLALEMVYGDERFVHSPHFLPLLMVLAALSTLTRARVLALVLAGTLVLSAGVNNGLQFSKAVQSVTVRCAIVHQ